MPAPIVHIAHAQQLLKLKPGWETGPLVRGTIFPDVRHIAGIDRNLTHRPHQVKLEQVFGEDNSWRAGYLLHNWVDDAWNEYFGQYGLEEGNPDHVLTWACLKLMEDGLIRERIEGAPEVAAALVEVDPEVADFGVDPEDVKKWGSLVAGEVIEGWMTPNWEVFASEGLGLPDRVIAKFRQRLAELQEDGRWEDRLRGCWESLSRQLKGFR